MTATLDPVRQQREILATFRRISLQRAQAEADAAARYGQENEAAEAAIATAREEEETQRLAAEQAAVDARNIEYAAAEERYAQQLRDGETGVAAAQKHWEGALTVLGLADLRHMLSEARTVPVRLQPGQEPAQELKRCTGEAAAAATRLEATVDGIMALRVEKQQSTATKRRRAPFFIVLVAFVLFLGYIGTRPCGIVSGLTGGGATCAATLHGASGPVEAVAYSTDGKLVAAASADGAIYIWQAAGHDAVRTLPGSSPLSALVFVAGGKQIAAGGDDGAVHFWEIATGKELTRQDTGAPVRALALSPDGNLLAVGGEDGYTALLPLLAKGPTTTLPGNGAVRAVAFSPDGKYVAAAGDDGVVRLWHTADGGSGATLDGHAGAVLALAFAPDGGSLAAAGASGAVLLWNPNSGVQLRTLPATGVGGALRGVAFSHDGARLFAAGDGKTVHIWDARSGRTLAVSNLSTALHGVAASPSNSMLALAGDDHTVLLRPGK